MDTDEHENFVLGLLLQGRVIGIDLDKDDTVNAYFVRQLGTRHVGRALQLGGHVDVVELFVFLFLHGLAECEVHGHDQCVHSRVRSE